MIQVIIIIIVLLISQMKLLADSFKHCFWLWWRVALVSYICRRAGNWTGRLLYLSDPTLVTPVHSPDSSPGAPVAPFSLLPAAWLWDPAPRLYNIQP